MALDPRKIRSVYDAIDSGAYKLALQTCNKLLKKSPKSNIVKTLKSLALLRSSKLEEAIQLCDEIVASRPTDEDVLSALTHVLRHLERHEDIITLYDLAFKKHPQNEDLGTQAFMAMVRIGQWKTAQQISLKLSRTFPSDHRFLTWSIMSALLQACDPATPENTKPILLTLALRLFQQIPKQFSSYSSPDILCLHLEILLAFAEPKLQEAYDLLSNDESMRMVESSLSLDEKRRTIWSNLLKYADERNLCRRRLDEGDRNWLSFLSYLDSTFGLIASSSPGDDLTVRGLLTETWTFLNELAAKDGRKERGAHLARLEFSKRMRERHRTSPSLEESGIYAVLLEQDGLLSMMKGYIANFSEKACCFEDLKPYVNTLSVVSGEDELKMWLQYLAEQESNVATAPALLRTLTVSKLLRYSQRSSGDPLPLSEESQGIQYFRTYLDALQFVGHDLESSELQPADDLALLAANSFVQAWVDGGKKSCKPLHQAVVVLEYASSRSVHNYQFRLLLVRIYLLLGAHSLALIHYKRLRVKSVQHETLSHFILTRGSTFSVALNGELTMIQEALDASQIYSDNASETPDMLTKALQHEKYSQIPNFIDFEDRLDRSLQRDIIKIEHIRMRFAVEPPTPDTLAIEISELDFMLFSGKVHHDNRDYSVLPNYQPQGSSINDQTSMGPRPGVHWCSIFVRLYVEALNKALEPSFYSSTLSCATNEEMLELTEGERTLVEYSHVLSHWLWPSDKARPDPGEVPYPKYKPEEYGSSSTNNTVLNGSSAEPKGTPEAAIEKFEDLARRLKNAVDGRCLSWEILHLASLMQEAFALLNIQSSPFGPNSNGKPKKADHIWSSVKTLKTRVASLLQEASSIVEAYSESMVSIVERKAFVADCELLYDSSDVQMSGFVTKIGNAMTDSRVSVLSAMAKGSSKLADGKRPVLPPI